MTVLNNRFCFVGLFALITACGGGTYNVPVAVEQGELEAEEKEETEEQNEDLEDGVSQENDSTEEPVETEEQEEDLPEQEETTEDACTYDSFNVAASRAFVVNGTTEQPIFVFQATSSAASPMNVLEVLSYAGEPYNGPDGPGSYSMDGNNYEDCSLCMLIYENCNDTSCDSVYFADLGSLLVSSAMEVNQNFNATLNNVVFREVSIDPDTYQSTPIQGGNTWCVDSLSINAVPEAYQFSAIKKQKAVVNNRFFR